MKYTKTEQDILDFFQDFIHRAVQSRNANKSPQSEQNLTTTIAIWGDVVDIIKSNMIEAKEQQRKG